MNGRQEAPGALALGAAVFLSGAALLGVEIVASRVLAPSFGSSLYVWGSLIGVVLTGLAIGYWAGGAFSDRYPTPYLLTGTLALGAALVLLVPVLDAWVIEQIVAWDPGPRLDPLLAAIALFAPVSIVLAAATPIAVRLAARSLERLGRTAGRLFSVSTAGSIVGTFAAAFWLVPELGTDQVLAVAAVTLLVAAMGYALAERLLVAALALMVAAVGAGLVGTTLTPQESGRLDASALRNWSPLYREREQRNPGTLNPDAVAAEELGYEVRVARDTRYHRMFVLDADEVRYLRFDSTFQSAMRLHDPFATVFAYTDYLQLGLAYAPTTRRVLFIGLGGGSAVKRMWRDFPSLQLHAVELDPDVVRVAERWFGLPRDSRLQVSVKDGRRFLQTNDQRWDMIVIDAYFADSIPFHLSTAQFYELARSRLSPGGVVVSNVIGSAEGPDSKLLRAIAKTYRAVFPTVALHPVGGGLGSGNVIVVATEGARPKQAVLEDNWNRLRASAPQAVNLRDAIRARWEGPIRFDDVPLLTDGYAPIDALLVGS
jgi:spermidine synthase